MDKTIDSITAACYQWLTLKKLTHFANQQTPSDPPETIGNTFAADVMKQEKQLIFILRECLFSYTTALLIEDEKAKTPCLAVI